MNAFKKSLLIGATIFSLAGSAFAAPGDQPDGGRGQGHAAAGEHQHKFDPAKFKEHFAKRQAQLHDKLKLNASQEAAWNTYAAAVTPPDFSKRPDRAEWAKLSAPERMERMLNQLKEHEARLTSRLAATKTFYAVLTPEQQKVFNDNTGPGHRHHGRHHGHGEARG